MVAPVRILGLTIMDGAANRTQSMQAKKTLFLAEWILASLITAIACVIHFYYWRHVGGLWRDEVNLVDISARHSFFDMAKDSFPVLMPLLVHIWRAAGFGGNDL